MASGSLHRLNNLFIHLLDAVGGEKENVRPAPKRAPVLTRATPGLIVAVLVWSLVFVLSVGTNGALAAALAQHLSLPPGLVDAFSSLAGKREPAPQGALTDLLVPSAASEIDHFPDSGLQPFAANGQALALSILAHIPNRNPDHGGLLGLEFMHALANNHPLYVDVSAHQDAWSHGGVASRTGITDPVRAGRSVRARSGGAVSDARSDDGPAPASHIPASHVVVAPYANEPIIDSVPWAKSTPNNEPASARPVDKLVTLDDEITTLVHRPSSLADDDVLPIDAVPDPRLAVDFAEPAAALAVTSVPAPGTMGLLAGAFLAWPIARRMRVGAARRTRPASSPPLRH